MPTRRSNSSKSGPKKATGKSTSKQKKASAPTSGKKKSSQTQAKKRSATSPKTSKTSKKNSTYSHTEIPGLSTVPVPRRKKRNEGPVEFFLRNIEEFEHSIDFNIPRGLLAGFLFMLVAEAISLFGIWMNRFYYTNLEFAGLWSRFVTPVAGQIPWSFFLYSALVSFFVGFIFSFFYHMVRVSIHGHAPHKNWVKGLLYGVFLTFVVGIPFLLHTFLVLGVPDLLAVSWFAESVMTFLAGGVVIASIMK